MAKLAYMKKVQEGNWRGNKGFIQGVRDGIETSRSIPDKLLMKIDKNAVSWADYGNSDYSIGFIVGLTTDMYGMMDVERETGAEFDSSHRAYKKRKAARGR